MTFREKNAAATLLILVAMYAVYGVWLLGHPHTRWEVLGALIVGVALMTLISIVWAIGLKFYSLARRERDEEADERDRRVDQKSARNAYWVILSILWVIPVVALVSPSHVFTANVVIATLGLAEMVHHGSRLYYYRWGA